jgi:hypothetical protein
VPIRIYVPKLFSDHGAPLSLVSRYADSFASVPIDRKRLRNSLIDASERDVSRHEVCLVDLVLNHSRHGVDINRREILAGVLWDYRCTQKASKAFVQRFVHY